MLAREVQHAKAWSPMWVTDSPKLMLAREVQPYKAPCPIWVTDSPHVMLARERQFSKAKSRMWVTDSGIVSKTSWCEFWKAASEMFVTLEGIFTPKHPCVWMSCLVAASTSFLVYVTVTRASAPKRPAASSVSASSMIELSRSSSTLRTLRSIGSWQGCFSRSIAFNSRTVAVVATWRVMTFPCKVFNWTSQDIAAKGQVKGRVAWKIVDYSQDMAKDLYIRLALWVFQNILHRVKLKAVSSALHLLQYVKGRLKIYPHIPGLWWYVEPSPLDCCLLSKSFMVPSCAPVFQNVNRTGATHESYTCTYYVHVYDSCVAPVLLTPPTAVSVTARAIYTSGPHLRPRPHFDS